MTILNAQIVENSVVTWNVCSTPIKHVFNPQWKGPLYYNNYHETNYAMDELGPIHAWGRIEMQEDAFITYEWGHTFVQNKACATSWTTVTPRLPHALWYEFVVYGKYVVAMVDSTGALMACKILTGPTKSAWVNISVPWTVKSSFCFAMTAHDDTIYIARFGQIWVATGNVPSLAFEKRVMLTPMLASVLRQ